jgi:hypothetical protein
MAKLLGKDPCICRNPNPGTFGVPKFIPIIAARDIKVARKPAAAFDSTDRITRVRTVIPVRQNLEISFSAIWNGGAGLSALRDSFVNDTVIELAYITGAPSTSAYGLRGDFIVSKFPIKFPLAGGQMIDIVLKPAANFTNRVRVFTDAGAGTLGTPEAQVNKKIGFNASVNNNTGTPIPTARDISWTMEWEEEEASDRAQEADGLGISFEQYLRTIPKVTAEFEVIWNDALHGAFRTAYDNGSTLQLTFLDGPYATTGSWGITSDWAITDFPNDSALNNGQLVKMQFAPHGLGTNLFQFTTRP